MWDSVPIQAAQRSCTRSDVGLSLGTDLLRSCHTELHVQTAEPNANIYGCGHEGPINFFPPCSKDMRSLAIFFSRIKSQWKCWLRFQFTSIPRLLFLTQLHLGSF